MKNTWRIVIGIVAAVGVLLLLRATLFGGPSDEVLIRQALQESILAGKEGRPGGVLDYLSQSFSINDQQMIDRKQISDFIRKAKPDVILVSTQAEVQGSSATVLTPVRVKFSGFGMAVDQEIPKVTITLKKETSTKWLVIPSSQWRIVSVTAPPESLTGLMPGF